MAKPLIIGALAALKLTGPWGWTARVVIPIFMEKVIKPFVEKWRRGQEKLKNSKLGSIKAGALRHAKTIKDRLNILNRK